jgi:calcineurin-like phosphoesterase family protein
MDAGIVKNWNEVVGKNDKTYLLGDVSFYHKDNKGLNLLNQLNGEIFLVRGNHDYTKSIEEYGSRFTWIKDYYELTVMDESLKYRTESGKLRGGKQKIILSHFPFLVWNHGHNGAWNLHGHSHGSLPDDPNALRIDVGVDCHDCYPVSYEAVKKLMSVKTWKPVDHHGNL